MNTNSPRVSSDPISCTQEEALDIIAQLEHPEVRNLKNMVYVFGKDKERGWIHIIVPAFGDSLLILPIVSRTD